MKLATLLALCVLGCQIAPVANNGLYVWYATGCGKRWVCNWEGKTLCRLSPWQQDECIKKEESK